MQEKDLAFSPAETPLLSTKDFCEGAFCSKELQIEKRAAAPSLEATKEKISSLVQQRASIECNFKKPMPYRVFESQVALQNKTVSAIKVKRNTPAFSPGLSTFFSEISTELEDVDVELTLSPKKERGRYAFSIKINPLSSRKVDYTPKEYLFIIDGSASVKAQRFQLFKESVQKALPYLKEGDLFNIFVLDTKFSALYPESQIVSRETRSEGKEFLHKRPFSGYFSRGDLYPILTDVLKPLRGNRETIAILLTDGKNLQDVERSKKSLIALAEQKRERLYLYTAACGSSVNRSTLSFLSQFYRGESLYSETQVSLPRKVATLVKNMHAMIASRVFLDLIPENDEARMELYPSKAMLPPLYEKTKYVLYGTTDQLVDFDLVFQGKNGRKMHFFKKKLSFNRAKRGSHSLHTEVAKQEMMTLCSYFLYQKHPIYLEEAQAIARLTHTPLP